MFFFFIKNRTFIIFIHKYFHQIKFKKIVKSSLLEKLFRWEKNLTNKTITKTVIESNVRCK